jgi:hypothetical protein
LAPERKQCYFSVAKSCIPWAVVQTAIDRLAGGSGAAASAQAGQDALVTGTGLVGQLVRSLDGALLSQAAGLPMLFAALLPS